MENAGKTKENGGCTMTHAGWTTKNADFTIKTLSTLIEWSSPWRTCWYVFGHVQCASIFVVHCTWYRWAPLEEQIGENTCNNHGYWHSEVDSIIQYIYIYRWLVVSPTNKAGWAHGVVLSLPLARCWIATMMCLVSIFGSACVAAPPHVLMVKTRFSYRKASHLWLSL